MILMDKVYFHTFGCRLNQAETAVLESVLREDGFRVVGKMADADIVVINSCTVTEAGDADVRRLVNRVRRENPLARIAVIGCQAQVQKQELLELPGVHWVVGTARKMDLAAIFRADRGRPFVSVAPIRREAFTMPLTRSFGSRTRANLKIQDGCDNFCAYCEVPYARGRTRSRVFTNVLEEARALVAAGHKEIVLTGVNVGLYMNDGRSLVDVVGALHDVPGLERIRISSIEGTSLPLDLVRFMFPKGRLCRFFHIPLQSGSDRILRRMGRGYLTHEYAQTITELAEKVPGIMLGTDVIVGFPGETKEDFERTCKFLKSLPMGYFHVFSYSQRRRARSRTFKGEVPSAEIARRSSVLRRLSAEKRETFLNGLPGSVEKVLFEQKKNDYWIGHTDNYVTIKLRLEGDLRNRILDVTMARIDGEAVIGSVSS
jgi:threonylcarbamoyladenosine tRNA methylthiotransferase MtaB